MAESAPPTVADDSGEVATEFDACSLQEAKQKYEYFWRMESPFSQWHRCSFEVEGQTYDCAEQFMMHQKAVLFGDAQTAERILNTSDPKLQKKLGRQAKGFDQDTWDRECLNIVQRGNKAKFPQQNTKLTFAHHMMYTTYIETLFSQSPKLKAILYSTYPRTLVEASPVDTIWGIGLPEDSHKAWNENTWRGKNLLGKALTVVRDEMMKEDGLV